jgi:hypothetical protein
MEYFSYDYSKIDNKKNFTNYDSFITNMKIYKYYLFDLSLLRYDSKVSKENRVKAQNLIMRQKMLIAFPYCFVFPILFYYHKRNFFNVGLIDKEMKLISLMLSFILIVRIGQKVLLKFEGDDILIDISKNKEHSL